MIVITGPDGSRKPFTPLSLIETAEQAPRVPPRGEIAVITPVFFGGDGWTFRQPGAYRLQAHWNADSAEELTSNVTSIQIVAGDGAGLRLVSNDSASFEAGKFLVWQSGDHLTEGRALLANIAEAFPASQVARHTHLAEGRNLSNPFRNFAAGTVRPANPEGALELLGRVEEAGLPVHLVVQKQLDEASALMQIAEWNAAASRLLNVQLQLDRNTSLREFLAPLQELDRVMLSSPQGATARQTLRSQQRSQ
ncbi:MAG TPA: hypothetical protein VGB24_16045 [Longimicrobium sp.]|jgi:hypothetical protein|uniref:hypothetical protein n=1 Tax=Longimicrobium sp. TaxID=2029185 RepID=UPI002ED8954A